MLEKICSLVSEKEEKVLCFYTNDSGKVQVTKIENIPYSKFERVVFPKERILFEALPEAQLEIYTGMMGTEVLLNTIICDRLQVSQKTSSLVLT